MDEHHWLEVEAATLRAKLKEADRTKSLGREELVEEQALDRMGTILKVERLENCRYRALTKLVLKSRPDHAAGHADQFRQHVERLQLRRQVRLFSNSITLELP